MAQQRHRRVCVYNLMDVAEHTGGSHRCTLPRPSRVLVLGLEACSLLGYSVTLVVVHITITERNWVGLYVDHPSQHALATRLSFRKWLGTQATMMKALRDSA